MKVLSKSKYVNGLQCSKYLWFAVNDPASIPEADKGLQFRFDQGHLISCKIRNFIKSRITYIPTIKA